jgi:hypothetical protein
LRQLELVYAQFLQCDLNTAGAATLPDVEARASRGAGARFLAATHAALRATFG